MKHENIVRSIVVGLSIIVTATILGGAIKNRNAAEDSISVVGLGTHDFESDEIYWSGSFRVKAQSAKEAYSTINADREKIREFFISKGFKESEFAFGGVSFSKSYRHVIIEVRGEETRSEDVFDGYIATQNVTFNSIKNPELMKKIEMVVDQTAELINSGIEFEGNSLQYTYSDLPSLKHDLIEKATQDANERAQKIVGKASGDLGKLKDASMGVFQITGKGSVEEDSYGGNFDTFNKYKTARITVRLTYMLN